MNDQQGISVSDLIFCLTKSEAERNFPLTSLKRKVLTLFLSTDFTFSLLDYRLELLYYITLHEIMNQIMFFVSFM